MCLLMIGTRFLSTVQLALSGQFGSAGTIVPLLIILWLAWNLYSGKLWVRNIAALYAVLLIAQSVLLFGALTLDNPLLLLFPLIIIINGGLIYLLFMYEPVQEYFRYVGGETI